MHTSYVGCPGGRFTVKHNQDYSGNIEIHRDTWGKPVWIPIQVLESIVAEKIRCDRIAKLEQAEPAELLK